MAEIRAKMVKLASRVKTELSQYDLVRLEIAVKELDRPTKEAIRKSIAGVLNESETSVRSKLAEHSDSDRLLDELIAHLDSATDNN